ncbi:MAG: M23 family metallopeptidase [Proteobacteria bacterium]|nr:M23 family metallopeptidase [Pseudomonadota bacterium]
MRNIRLKISNTAARRQHVAYGLPILMLLMTSCTQEPAAVERKEQMRFGRNAASNTVVRNAPNNDAIITSEPIMGTEVGANRPQLRTPQRMVGEPGVEQQLNRPSQTLEDQLANQHSKPDKQPQPSVTKAEPKQSQEQYMEIEELPAEPEELKQGEKLAKPPSQREPALSSAAKPKGGYKTATPMDDPNYAWPAYGQVLSRFQHGKNEGMNIAVAKGASIAAAADGEVVYVGEDSVEYGKMLIIKHPGNIFTAYAHADKITINQGAKVRKGQVIASAGQTGSVDAPQVYFSVRKDDDTINPEQKITH